MQQPVPLASVLSACTLGGIPNRSLWICRSGQAPIAAPVAGVLTGGEPLAEVLARVRQVRMHGGQENAPRHARKPASHDSHGSGARP